VRNPIDVLTEGLPHGWRVTIDWLVTIVGAIAIVLAIKAWVVNPYRIPSSSMEPTLHCARPGNDCEARFSDRVLACRFCFKFWEPKRGDIVVFKTPPLADARCGAGGTFVKRLIGLPGETWEERNGYVYINGKLQEESYIQMPRRDSRTITPIKIHPRH
jgi:signal peptidase I